MTTTEPSGDTPMLKAFDKFKAQIDDAYAEARHALEIGNLTLAQQVLAQIATTHARTSLSLRNYLIKKQFITGDES